ncbi:hypothetical protein GCM10010112_92700 [Actinoplanes lobatus]|uniref:Uncharacterized protein n=1 Tax=Actinoplanes lobatus TaxID=113568 RepID=A0A7W7MKS8_9ACTN|nr:hypothetical protein [Actinoplanes lobatus]MBB4754009.1 hypothetical protein [Actinoplanes lobatus]GGN99157.1 hypothetical protein GCM10010112_92700 [Actinoplanes lobatus]GIE44057.1 hypothetical protein Alo02nite_69550 [Actinoplanes lobatus]
MPSDSVLTDEVWRGLDPRTGMLPVRTRRRLALIAAVLLALVVAAVVIDRSGVLAPRLTAHPGWFGWFVYGDATNPLAKTESMVNRRYAAPTEHVAQGFDVTNDNQMSLTIVGVEEDRPGMTVERVTVGNLYYDEALQMTRTGGETLTPDRPYVLPPGETLSIKVYYHVTDCRAVPASAQPIPVRIRRLTGPHTIEVPLYPLRPYPTGGWHVSTTDDPDAVPWQRFLADHVCR